ncbi:MAG: hypothetical protein S4CHLAM7_08390 [Chlamydiae bacterium]|nr:hypothetical protein [Chlamydiota bacterium]
MLEIERETLHRLLTHFHPNDFEEYFKFFDEHERTSLSKIQPIKSPLNLCLDDLITIFKRIHYSWYISSLETFPKESLSECFELFSKDQVVGLEKHKILITPNQKQSSFLKNCFLERLLKDIGLCNVLPTCFLPDSKSKKFLKFSKIQLVELIQHLGVLEIANLSKKIVAKQTINQIEKLLARKHKKTFKLAQRTSEPKASSTRDLAKVLKDKKSFAHFLEKRGIERFARGLVLDHSSLIWHIAHILDKGRGQELLIKSRRFMPNPYTPFFNKQLLDTSEMMEVIE